VLRGVGEGGGGGCGVKYFARDGGGRGWGGGSNVSSVVSCGVATAVC
jgi:hypothetical protein